MQTNHQGELSYMPHTPGQSGSVFFFELPLFSTNTFNEPFCHQISSRSTMFMESGPNESFNFLLGELDRHPLSSCYAELTSQEHAMELVDVNCMENEILQQTAESELLANSCNDI
mmetsp:Transcript_12858/g.17532  ORF Transcript_12858/g.17532 Transcript_12858/m.17532 type:complete len:115 (-) Transcript_12858:752-1096(-)